jgi:hypothetical protein
MKRFHLLLLAVVSAPLGIHAEPVRISTAVTEASAAVSPPKYQSAYAGYKPAVEPQTTPDKFWIQANREVSGQSEHREGSSMQMAPAPTDSAKLAAAPVADPHKGHGMNKKGQ